MKLSPPHATGTAADLAERPAHEPRRDVAEVAREPVAQEHEDEPRDDDAEHRDADERRRRERRALLVPFDREQEDRDDREREVDELVPEADERDRARDVPSRESPSAA